jgi:predicted GH43/DUF377 family glycosyl hydrolase
MTMSRTWLNLALLAGALLTSRMSAEGVEPFNHLIVSPPIAPITGQLSMAVNFPGEGSQVTTEGMRTTYATAKNLGISLNTLYYMWSELEPNGAGHQWGGLDLEMQLLAEQNLRASFILKVIDTSQLGTFPDDLRFQRFDDPIFMSRLTRFVRALLDRYPRQIAYMWIGNEIDDYFFNHRGQIGAYSRLYSTVAAAAKASHPEVKVGTISTYHDAKMQKALDVIQSIGAAGDIIGFSLYPQAITGATPTSTEKYFLEMSAIAQKVHKPFSITETNWSADGMGGSESRQVAYIHDLFRVYRKYRSQIETLGLFVLYDFSDSVNRALAEQVGLAGHGEFLRFTATLGYAKNNGAPRPSWTALKDELRTLRAPDPSAIPGIIAPGWIQPSCRPVIESDNTALDGIPGDPWVIKDPAKKSRYLMYYGAVKGDLSDERIRIFRATSTDGMHWTRRATPVLVPTSGAWDATNVETPCVVKIPGNPPTLAMYYAGASDTGVAAQFSLGLARSADGIAWKKAGTRPILPRGASGEFDSYSVLDPSVIVKDGRYSMWYVGISDQFQTAIGLATSRDGVTWRKKGVVLRLDGERRHPDDAGVTNPAVIWNGRSFDMFYSLLGAEGVIAGPLFRAASLDGMHWTKNPVPVLEVGSGSHWTAKGVSSACALLEPGKISLWYAGINTDYTSFIDAGIGYIHQTLADAAPPLPSTDG